MDDSKRLILKEQWDKIVKDLYVEHILDELYSLGTINNHELETIRNKNTRADAVESLLKYVVKKDNRAFDNFKSVLKKDYDWLSVALQENHDQNDLHVTTEQLAFQDSLVLGNVPRQPPYYVRRTIPVSTG
uniref:CARD domain-containing protein n=1 Tax=Photinus pyralis TaxID=7054 RepID=A0A1Y1N7C1_PHOPY